MQALSVLNRVSHEVVDYYFCCSCCCTIIAIVIYITSTMKFLRVVWVGVGVAVAVAVCVGFLAASSAKTPREVWNLDADVLLRSDLLIGRTNFLMASILGI